MTRKAYTILILTVWTLVLAIFVAAEIIGEKSHVREIAIRQATGIIHEMDELMEWNLSFDRVFVDAGKHTPDSLNIPPGIVETNDGERLSQIIFPTLLRQVSSIGLCEHGIKTHISSLKALNAVNEPNEWERAALKKLESGADHQAGFLKDEKGDIFFQYMKPFYIEIACLNCHSEQGYKVGDVRAGITAQVPVNDLVGRSISHSWQVGSIALFLWVMGLCFAVLLNRHYAKDQLHIQELTGMSLNDELTSLYNRRGFLIIAQKNVQLIRRMEGMAVIFFFDLDRFKEINDTYGHPAGDEVLLRMAKVLRSTFRESDVIARFGGDEFIVMAIECQEGCADGVLERLHGHVRESNIVAGTFYELILSVGMAEFDPSTDSSVEEIILKADELMYKDKERRKKDRITN